MRIFLAGGASGGATAPVLSVAEAIAELAPGSELFLVGSRGIERKMIGNSKIAFTYLTIPAGKWRRYFSLMNFIDLFRIGAGFLKSLYLIGRYKPGVVFGSGSFVQVPLAVAAFLWRVPVVIHQPDLELLLSTKLVAPIARVITVSFSWSGKHLSDFSGLLKKIKESKIKVTGNPVRREVFGGSREEARKLFNLNADYPALLVMGGSQGAAVLNEIIATAAPTLVKYVQIIHVLGRKPAKKPDFQHPHYHTLDYLGQNLKDAYAVSDLVICRGGISTITELGALKLPAIVIPLPHSPQETNARLLAMTGSAVAVPQEYFNPALAVSLVRKLIWDGDAVSSMKNKIAQLAPSGADKKIAKIILAVHDDESRNK